MKKLLFLAVLVAAAYKFLPNSFPFLSTPGAFDKGGKALVVVFLGPNCGGPCDAVQDQTIDLVGSDGAPNGYPLT